jgi:tetratricopeptide (TPR) repeat protein
VQFCFRLSRRHRGWTTTVRKHPDENRHGGEHESVVARHFLVDYSGGDDCDAGLGTNSGARAYIRQHGAQGFITISISGLAFLISMGGAIFNWWSWKKKNLEDAKKTLAEAIVGMIATRQQLEEFRVTSGEKFGSNESAAYRGALNDQRQLYLSKALQIEALHDKALTPSYSEYMMLAATLIDLGRTADSVRFYEKSLALATAANDEVARAAARRVYGRAQIASGNYDLGRKEMLTAASEYKALASQRAYDRDRMFGEAAETYRRLIWVEKQTERMETVGTDLSALEALLKEIKDPIRHRAVAGGLKELQKVVGAPEAEQQLAIPQSRSFGAPS